MGSSHVAILPCMLGALLSRQPSEVRIPLFVEFVQLHARLCRVHLQVKRGDFYRFLLLASEPRQALRKGVGNAEFHGVFSSYSL